MTIRRRHGIQAEWERVRAHCAHFGDPDLDFLIHSARITAVVWVEPELIVHSRGGHGMWVNSEGQQEIRQMNTATFNLGYVEVGEHVEAVVEILTEWRDGEDPVRIAMAPGRHTTVAKETDPSEWVPLPRARR